MPQPLTPNEFLPNKDRTALLVIDIQERLSAAMPAERLPGVLRSTSILVSAMHEFDLPVLVSEQYPKGLGPTLPEVKAALSDAIQPIEKIDFSCCGAAGFQQPLQALAGYDFILCGMETHVCVLQTALGLLQRGHHVYVAADAVCSRTAFNEQIALDVMRQAGAVIGSAEMFAFGLLGAAGTDTFKHISKLVK